MILRKITLSLFLLLPIFLQAQTHNTAKPWAYWWWLGSAVDEKGITKNLEDFAAAGFGGLHIIPIYGVKGEEAKFIPYLSPPWVAILDYTVQEANRLGLGIDMTLGTGWPFGGSHVSEADAAKAFKIRQDATGKYILDIVPTKQKVKRAAPGAEGWVLDHFSTPSQRDSFGAVSRYFQPFDSVFSKKNVGVRAFYNDSYEVYGANWTADFFQQFKLLRGYDLAKNLDVLAKDTAVTDREKAIWSDYHETLSDLLFNGFTKEFNQFAKRHGKITRNEAHGSPANILDLYALNDVPESEFFGSKPYNIPLYRQDPDYDIRRFGVPGDVVLKLASSAAHVSGKRLVSSETATWLGNHFKVSLSQIKPIVDESFVNGINHIFYHGIPYSPPDAVWPGWLFYASTNFNQQAHFWNTLPQLNGYIERCQKQLQDSKPDNDLLLYFPLYDLWHSAGRKDKIHTLDVHALLRDGFLNPHFEKTIKDLQAGGFTFDFVSDRQLQSSKTIRNQLVTEGGTAYKAVVIPRCDYMPLPTLAAIAQFKAAGIPVVFVDKLPSSVNGFFEKDERQKQFLRILEKCPPSVSSSFLIENLKKQGIRFEKMGDKGLSFIRKKTVDGTRYFIVNQNQKFERGTIPLATKAEAVRINYPLGNRVGGYLSFQKIGTNKIEIPLELQSGESVFIDIIELPIKTSIKTSIKTPIKSSGIAQIKPALSTPQYHSLKGKWQVEFLKGEPFLPKSFETEKLESWTNRTDDTTPQYFSGTARYTLIFNNKMAIKGKTAWLDLGDVRETALVRLNGQVMGLAWSLPFQVPIKAGVLKQGENRLEIEVTNLSANRIRYLDKKGEVWRKFYDINFVDITYRPFDAAAWQPIPSGLLGDVKLVFR